LSFFDRKLLKFLSECKVARLATLNDEDKTIHIVPIVFANDRRHIYFAIDRKPKKTVGNLRRLVNIRRNPNKVSVLLDKYSENWHKLSFVLIYASAEILSSSKGDHNREVDRVLRALERKYPQYRAGGYLPRPEKEDIFIVRLTPSKIVKWFAKSASK
jgi:PPOX class probable F420-dependent enzyme